MSGSSVMRDEYFKGNEWHRSRSWESVLSVWSVSFSIHLIGYALHALSEQPQQPRWRSAPINLNLFASYSLVALRQLFESNFKLELEPRILCAIDLGWSNIIRSAVWTNAVALNPPQSDAWFLYSEMANYWMFGFCSTLYSWCLLLKDSGFICMQPIRVWYFQLSLVAIHVVISFGVLSGGCHHSRDQNSTYHGCLRQRMLIYFKSLRDRLEKTNLLVLLNLNSELEISFLDASWSKEYGQDTLTPVLTNLAVGLSKYIKSSGGGNDEWGESAPNTIQRDFRSIVQIS